MALDHTTRNDGTQYLPIIPETIQVPRDYVGMPEIVFGQSNGDRVKVMMYRHIARELRDALNAMDLGG